VDEIEERMNQLQDYQEQALHLFTARRSIEGATILEVGGTYDSAVARWLLDKGAREVWVTNPRMARETERVGRIVYASCYSQEISKITDTRFDSVFGIAVIEHFRNLPASMAQFHAILKKRGSLFLHGGPIWSYATGHHVWVDGAKRYYMTLPTNPIKPWEHITSTPEEIGRRLLGEGIPERDIDAILDYIFFGDRLSRLTYNDFRRIFDESPGFAPREWFEIHGDIAPGAMEPQISRRIGSQPFSVIGLCMGWTAI
jgi:hypothetical protein